jgi:hypothetical protein
VFIDLAPGIILWVVFFVERDIESLLHPQNSHIAERPQNDEGINRITLTDVNGNKIECIIKLNPEEKSKKDLNHFQSILHNMSWVLEEKNLKTVFSIAVASLSVYGFVRMFV